MREPAGPRLPKPGGMPGAIRRVCITVRGGSVRWCCQPKGHRFPGSGRRATNAQPETRQTVARAAMPSSRPVKPNRSEVVAFTLTCPGAQAMIEASAACMAAA